MLGVFFLAGPESMVARGPALLQANRAREHWHEESISGPGYFLGVVSITADRLWRSRDGRYVCAVDGWMSSDGAHWQKSLGEFAKNVMSHGEQAALGYRGEFTAVVLDTERRRGVVVNDRFGRRPVYLNTGERGIRVSTDIRGLFTTGLARPVLNKPYVSTLLRLNKVRPGTDTIFSGVETLPPGSCLEMDFLHDPRTRLRTYYRHSFDTEEDLSSDWPDHCIASLRGSVERALDRASGPVGVTLSGGLDSRLLLAAMPERRRRRLVAASYGIQESAEARIAREVGDVAGLTVDNVPISADDYLDLARDGPRKNEEYDIFVQAAQALPNRYLAARADYVMSGWDLDIALRGLYVDEDVARLEEWHQLPKTIFAKWGLFRREELKRLFKPDFYRCYIDSAEAAVDEALADVPGATPLKRYLAFIFQYEKQRLLMLRSRFIRHEVETLTPFYDEDLQTLLSTVPERERAGNRLFQRVFSRLSPQLHALTYQRTMLPGDTDPAYWTEGARLEQQREMLYRRIYRETGRLIEYKRYYSNFAQWLLSDSGWRALVDRLLISGDALLYEEIAEPGYVTELIERDRQSDVSEFPKIVHLMSMELHLREYFA